MCVCVCAVARARMFNKIQEKVIYNYVQYYLSYSKFATIDSCVRYMNLKVSEVCRIADSGFKMLIRIIP
jgi:hypothetical protein